MRHRVTRRYAGLSACSLLPIVSPPANNDVGMIRSEGFGPWPGPRQWVRYDRMYRETLVSHPCDWLQ